ncbi:MAG: lipopolysaccharide heptosyltransferase [Pseudomonadota bacterium]
MACRRRIYCQSSYKLCSNICYSNPLPFFEKFKHPCHVVRWSVTQFDGAAGPVVRLERTGFDFIDFMDFIGFFSFDGRFHGQIIRRLALNISHFRTCPCAALRQMPPTISELNIKTVARLKILLVKLSSLGDVLHTLPVVHDIKTAQPDAQIDWVVEAAFAGVVRRCDGVNNVITCELRKWRKTLFSAKIRQAWRVFQANLQREHYDAVIDLQGLTKSALVSKLAKLSPTGKRYAMANRTDGSSYEAPTRCLAGLAGRNSVVKKP